MTSVHFTAVLIIFAIGTLVRSAPVEREGTEQQDVGQLRKEIVQLKGYLNEAVGSWAEDKRITADSLFLATISEYSVSLTPGQPIIWDDARINPVGHFNTTLGLCTAPVNGYYQFSANKYGTENQGSFYFLVDGVKVAFEYIYSPITCCPNGDATINLELSAGQTVSIENHLSTRLYGTGADGLMFSWFTGHLLYAQ